MSQATLLVSAEFRNQQAIRLAIDALLAIKEAMPVMPSEHGKREMEVEAIKLAKTITVMMSLVEVKSV